jgi:CBS domain-containing protein
MLTCINALQPEPDQIAEAIGHTPTGEHLMRAMDVMTGNVITVTPETPVQDLAKLLSQHGISGVPVVNAENRLVGIVSEGDLLHRTETGTERRIQPRRVRWLDGLMSDHNVARDYLKSHGRHVQDVMTRDVITVEETTELAEIADLLETKRVRRVPVVRDGAVVGIVSRANLVRALAMVSPETPNGTVPDDFAIRDALLTELRGKPWAKVWASEVMVRNNVVHVWYSDDQPVEERNAIRIAAENTPGVTRVEEHLVHVPMIPVL